MTSVTMTETRFAATPAVAQQQTHSPNRLVELTDTITAVAGAIRSFVSSCVCAPVRPGEAPLEALVVVAMLKDETDFAQSDTFTWNMPN